MRPLRFAVLTGALAALALPSSAGAAAPQLYVSLGDSYATGYQPKAAGFGTGTSEGYANQLVPKAARRGWKLRLVNFGCGGETTTSILRRTAPCPSPAVGGPRYAGRTQVAAAESFLRRNRKRVGLVTVSIGGNDVTSCARAGAGDPVACVGGAVASIKANVATVVKRLRAAAGPRVRIVGLTYPDVILGQWVGPDADPDLATLSTVAFKALINPALKASYASGRGSFVDVTAATGAYGPMDRLVEAPGFGQVPAPVARVCELTWYCLHRDIHAKRGGYALIADLIAASLPRRR